ncbi:MAG: hypothetical protein R6V45_09330 [Oceanipulchritudo sp.]
MASVNTYYSRPASVIRVSGEDHLDFLQSQGTADLRGPEKMAVYCLWLDHKGQIQGDSFVLKLSEEEVLLISYETPEADLLKKFDHHIIADDVELEASSAQWRLYSVPPDSVNGFLAERSLSIARSRFGKEADGYVFHGRRLGPGSIDYLVPAEGEKPRNVTEMESAKAEAIRIKAGIPSIPRDIPPGTTNPLEAGIISALSFDKGCYLGQEVVARIHRLQRRSARLVQAVVDGELPTLPFPLAEDDREVGSLSTAAADPETGSTVAIGKLKAKVSEGTHTFGDLSMDISDLPSS